MRTTTFLNFFGLTEGKSVKVLFSRLGTQDVQDIVLSETDRWKIKLVIKEDVDRNVVLMKKGAQEVIVKRSLCFGWRKALACLIHGSPAVRSGRAAKLLSTLNFCVPKTLAIIENRRRLFGIESIYVSEALPHSPLNQYWERNIRKSPRSRRDAFIKQLAKFVASLHAAGVHSGDLRDANILVEQVTANGSCDWLFYLVDLDNITRRAQVTTRRRIKNLVQLDRTLGRRASQSGRLLFLYKYLSSHESSPDDRALWIKWIRKTRDAKDREYARRRKKHRALISRASEAHQARAQKLPGPVRREALSCCIICKDEEENINRCLESVKWCDEIVIIDSFSSDKTIPICQEYPTRIIQRTWPGYVEQKRFALSQAKNNWVLNVDADEEVTPLLRKEIEFVLQQDDPAVDGYYIPRLVRYLGKWWWRGWYPGYRLRLFRKDKVNWGGINPHEKVLLRGTADRLRGNLYHYTYDDISDHLQTINGLTDVSSRELSASQRPIKASAMVFRPLWRFFSFYFVRGCFLDGIPGLFISVTSAFYVFLKYAKLAEQTSLITQGSIESAPNDTPTPNSARRPRT